MLSSRTVCSKLAHSFRAIAQKTQVRYMAGHGSRQEPTISKIHTAWGEAFGVMCWLWVFYRAWNDLDVFLGFRHPWEHPYDMFAPAHEDHDDDHHHIEDGHHH